MRPYVAPLGVLLLLAGAGTAAAAQRGSASCLDDLYEIETALRASQQEAARCQRITEKLVTTRETRAATLPVDGLSRLMSPQGPRGDSDGTREAAGKLLQKVLC